MFVTPQRSDLLFDIRNVSRNKRQQARGWFVSRHHRSPLTRQLVPLLWYVFRPFPSHSPLPVCWVQAYNRDRHEIGMFGWQYMPYISIIPKPAGGSPHSSESNYGVYVVLADRLCCRSSPTSSQHHQPPPSILSTLTPPHTLTCTLL